MNKDYCLGVLQGFIASLSTVPDCVKESIEFLREEAHPTPKIRENILNTTFPNNPISDGVSLFSGSYPNDKSDEEKISAHLEEKGVVKVKPKRTSNMSEENKAKAAQRMRDYQARKKAAKLHAADDEEDEREDVGEASGADSASEDAPGDYKPDPVTGAIKIF